MRPYVLIPLWQWTSGAPRADRMWFGLALILLAVLGCISGHTL